MDLFDIINNYFYSAIKECNIKSQIISKIIIGEEVSKLMFKSFKEYNTFIYSPVCNIIGYPVEIDKENKFKIEIIHN